VIAELSYTDLKTGEPALTHLRHALTRHKHVVTTNKGPIALHYPELLALAEANNVQLGVEGTVMSGTPVLRMAKEMLSAANITGWRGLSTAPPITSCPRWRTGQTMPAPWRMPRDAATQKPTRPATWKGSTRRKNGHPGQPADGSKTFPSRRGPDRHYPAYPEDIAAAAASGERWKLIGKLERAGTR